jgi:hypothetical protein
MPLFFAHHPVCNMRTSLQTGAAKIWQNVNFRPGNGEKA